MRRDRNLRFRQCRDIAEIAITLESKLTTLRSRSPARSGRGRDLETGDAPPGRFGKICGNDTEISGVISGERRRWSAGGWSLGCRVGYRIRSRIRAWGTLEYKLVVSLKPFNWRQALSTTGPRVHGLVLVLYFARLPCCICVGVEFLQSDVVCWRKQRCALRCVRKNKKAARPQPPSPR